MQVGLQNEKVIVTKVGYAGMHTVYEMGNEKVRFEIKPSDDVRVFILNLEIEIESRLKNDPFSDKTTSSMKELPKGDFEFKFSPRVNHLINSGKFLHLDIDEEFKEMFIPDETKEAKKYAGTIYADKDFVIQENNRLLEKVTKAVMGAIDGINDKLISAVSEEVDKQIKEIREKVNKDSKDFTEIIGNVINAFGSVKSRLQSQDDAIKVISKDLYATKEEVEDDGYDDDDDEDDECYDSRDQVIKSDEVFPSGGTLRDIIAREVSSPKLSKLIPVDLKDDDPKELREYIAGFNAEVYRYLYDLKIRGVDFMYVLHKAERFMGEGSKDIGAVFDDLVKDRIALANITKDAKGMEKSLREYRSIGTVEMFRSALEENVNLRRSLNSVEDRQRGLSIGSAHNPGKTSYVKTSDLKPIRLDSQKIDEES